MKTVFVRCLKKPFTTRKEAERWIRRIRGRGYGHKLPTYAYCCRTCNVYRVTTQTKEAAAMYERWRLHVAESR